MHVVEIGGYGPGQDYRIDRQFEFGERLRQLGLVGLAQGEEELLVLMFDDQLDEGGERPVGERDLAFAVDDVLLQVEATASVWQMYFMVSGTVMRASSQMWKKLSTVVRDVKMTAVCVRISTRCARNSFSETRQRG